ncbi:MAG: hypothetical protein E6G56_00745 [Actinobacteria bacterium]|nr:MAG: hypothetical protein E6G56_00745 [Actinomycetota bacterium]
MSSKARTNGAWRAIPSTHPRIAEKNALGAQNLGQRPEPDPRAIRRAPPGAQERRLVAIYQLALELTQQAGLTNSGLAHERHQLRSTVHGHTLKDRRQQAELAVAADEGHVVLGASVRGRAADQAHRLPG